MNKKSLFCLVLFLSLAGVFSACTKKPIVNDADTPTDGGGDDGGGGGGGANPTPILDRTTITQGNYLIIFPTDGLVDGSGGVNGAGTGLTSMDALCNSEAVTKNLGGLFKAFVTGGQRKPLGTEWVLKDSKEYRRLDQTTVIGTASEVFFGGITQGVKLPFPASASISDSTKYAWTGLTYEGDLSTDNCASWTTSTSFFGSVGKSDVISDTIVDTYSSTPASFFNYPDDPTRLDCSNQHALYCVQTTPAPPVGSYKIMFMSTSTALGNVGVPGFDALCVTDATTKGLTGTYKALVSAYTPSSSGSVSNVRTVGVDWPLQANMNYRREGALLHVGTTDSSGVFPGDLSIAFTDAATPFWSGTANTWGVDGSDGCDGWSTLSGVGRQGDGSQIDPTHAIYDATPSCNTQLPVLCVQQ